VLEALGRLCREAGPEAVALLRGHAPTWLVQMPWLVAEADRAALQRETLGGTQERMLREATEALEALAARTPLVLVLEDLHWSDPSSLDAIALLAQRHESARLLVVATYRPVDAILDTHPVRDLKQRLVLQRQAREIAPELLTAADTASYLAARLEAAPPAGLADVVQQRTDGNPLFMVMVIDELLAAGRLTADENGWTLREGLDEVAAAVPDGVRQMVERQIERLAPHDVEVLEAAALERAEFSAALVAAALDDVQLVVEQRCEYLARQQRWILSAGLTELPDGGVSGCYRFVYDLYQSVLTQRVPAARRMRLHQRMGEWLERTAGDAGLTRRRSTGRGARRYWIAWPHRWTASTPTPPASSASRSTARNGRFVPSVRSSGLSNVRRGRGGRRGNAEEAWGRPRTGHVVAQAVPDSYLSSTGSTPPPLRSSAFSATSAYVREAVATTLRTGTSAPSPPPGGRDCGSERTRSRGCRR
jgi:hypothetical protein